MENKEAILNSMPIWTFKDFEEEKFYRRKNVLEAMGSFSASQNEELRKELDRMKNIIIDLDESFKEQFDLAQKFMKYDFENSEKITQLQSTIDEKNKEIERLKGLIEDAHEAGYNDGTFNEDVTISESWEQFKVENNL